MPAEIEALFGISVVEPFPPRYNIAPTQPILAVIGHGALRTGAYRPDRRTFLVRWGLVPSWAKDPKDLPLLFNARSESAAAKPAFRAAMRYRRALIPASGFYEWRRAGSTRPRPYWIRAVSGQPFAFAGLVEHWTGPDGAELDTASILTTSANERLAEIHPRMPVVIPEASYDRWLNCSRFTPDAVSDLLAPVGPNFFEPVPICDKVNNIANMGPDILEPVGQPPGSAAEAAPPDLQLKLF
jgi:putative SOS response-associated peptidase YedK